MKTRALRNSHQGIRRRLAASLLLAAVLTIAPQSRAVTFLSGPSFTSATNAPLAGLLTLRTDVPCRVSVQVSDGAASWERAFYEFATTHSIPLLGFKPGRTHRISVTVHDKGRNASTAPASLTFVTVPLPANFPPITVLKSAPEKMEPGYTLFIVHPNAGTTGHYIVILDSAGSVVWYSPAPTTTSFDIRQLDNGNLFTEANGFLEMNMLGQTVRTWSAAPSYPVNVHEGVPTSHGTILYLSDVTRSVPNFPSSAASNAMRWTANVNDNPVVEISATNGALLNAWPLVPMLNPTRISYLTYEFTVYTGVDNIHANAIIDVTNENSIIVSMRSQNAVIKFSRTGQLKWILGTPANWGTAFQPYLLTPQGAPFEWNYGQHSPKITPQGTLLLYDNGDERASPFAPRVADQTNYSRAVEYRINETNMTVTQVWDSTGSDTNRMFSRVMGDADWLPRRQNVLVTHAYVTYLNGAHPSPTAANAMMGRIREVTHSSPSEVVFDVSVFDYTNKSPSYAGHYIYRSDRIPDLYPHPLAPLASLVLLAENRSPRLEFCADRALRHIVEASTDLENWTTVGLAEEQDTIGNFAFDDPDADASESRFYRVVTRRPGAGE